MHTLRCLERRFGRRFSFKCQLCCLLALGLPSLALAQPRAADAPGWVCWYEARDYSLRCLLARTPQSLEPARAERIRQAVDRRLPEIVRVIRAAPERLGAHQITIPLWTEPYEMEFARELAVAVMCGVRDDCSVVFDANADRRAPQRAAALVARDDDASGEPDAETAALLAEIEFVNQPLLAPRPLPVDAAGARRP